MGEVRPDDQMPQDDQGRSFDVLMSDDSTVSRGNPVQQIGGLLGRIAEKTGKHINVEVFRLDRDDVSERARQLTDPKTFSAIRRGSRLSGIGIHDR